MKEKKDRETNHAVKGGKTVGGCQAKWSEVRIVVGLMRQRGDQEQRKESK
jgi:hypothetical protein